MTIVRVKGIKRYRVRGRWYAYHRRTKTPIKSEFGTGAFFAELAAIEQKLKRDSSFARDGWGSSRLLSGFAHLRGFSSCDESGLRPHDEYSSIVA